MIAGVTESRSASAFLHCLATIKAPDARAKAATYLHNCLQRYGPPAIPCGGVVCIPCLHPTLPSHPCRHGQRLVSSPLFEKILRAAVLLLEEGSLEARSAGKRILQDLHALAGREKFRKSLFRLEVRIDKVLGIIV